MPPALISERDLPDFLAMLRDYRAGLLGPSSSRRPLPEPDPVAPECYVVRVPTGGVAAVAENTTGTGTGTVLEDDVAPHVLCEVYRVDEAGLFHAAGFSRDVYNVGTSAIPGDVWWKIEREKFGRWIFDVSATSGGGGGSGTLTIDDVDGSNFTGVDRFFWRSNQALSTGIGWNDNGGGTVTPYLVHAGPGVAVGGVSFSEQRIVGLKHLSGMVNLVGDLSTGEGIYQYPQVSGDGTTTLGFAAYDMSLGNPFTGFAAKLAVYNGGSDAVCFWLADNNFSSESPFIGMHVGTTIPTGPGALAGISDSSGTYFFIRDTSDGTLYKGESGADPVGNVFLGGILIELGTDGVSVDWADLTGNPSLGPGVMPPSSAGSPGVVGQVNYDSSFLYLCVATDTWCRVAIATW